MTHQDPAELSVAELRRLFVDGGERTSEALLDRLRGDARQGVRQLAAQLERRRARALAEEQRAASLLDIERKLWRRGLRHVAGVDEVGLGPLAGPVVAAAVVFEPELSISGVDDSKRLDAATRERLAEEIHARALAVGIGQVEAREVDELNVHQAGLVAMRRAVEALDVVPEHVIVDARTIPGLRLSQAAYVKGDAKSFTIAAASIVAKVHRDRLMVELDARHPQYGFAGHKGYCTREHEAALQEHGPSPAHRMSYPVLRELMGECSPLFYELRDRMAQAGTREECAALEADLGARRVGLAEEESRKLRTLLVRRMRSVSAALENAKPALPHQRPRGRVESR